MSDGDKAPQSVIRDAAFEARRQKGREAAGRFQEEANNQGDPLGWFEPLYQNAGRDPALVPWGNLEPNPALTHWLAKNGAEPGETALDVGCGLGDNAAALTRAGWTVTAFDLSPTAITWARDRFSDGSIDFQVADLFDAPSAWQDNFDFVHELYTLQALGEDLRSDAMQAIASFVKPGGLLLVTCRGRDDNEVPQGPPWPLSLAELSIFSKLGLSEVKLDDFIPDTGRIVRHFQITYRKPVA